MTSEPTLWEKYMMNPLKADPGMNGYCGVHKCQNMPWRESPLCKPHAWDMWVQLNGEVITFEEEMEAAQRRFSQREDEKRTIIQEGNITTYRRPKPRDTAPGTIYYLEIGDHLKIGFTTNIEHRMRTYPPFSKLLATHPGTLQTERDILAKFQDDLSMGQEWFNPSPEIDEHIRLVQEQFPDHASGKK